MFSNQIESRATRQSISTTVSMHGAMTAVGQDKIVISLFPIESVGGRFMSMIYD